MSKQKPLGSEQGRELRRLIWEYVGAARRYEAEHTELMRRRRGSAVEFTTLSHDRAARAVRDSLDAMYAYINELTDWDR